MYQPRRHARSEHIPIRNHRYHVRIWGEPSGQPPLVMVHGWMDVSASWQFVVDAMAQDHWVVAPDWRGYGLTEGPPTDSYWFPDYYADLDFLLDHYSPDAPVRLVGHSMGGNVAMFYAGARPQRVARLVNIEGFGLARTQPGEAPARLARFVEQLRALHHGELGLRPYASLEDVAQRLRTTNPRLPHDHARWLAGHWSRPGTDGQYHLLADAAHKIVNPYLFQVEEALEAYRRITAPVLWIEAERDSLAGWWRSGFTRDEFQERLRSVAQLEQARLADAGHMLHHDQPQQVARLIETFCAKSN